MAVCGAGSAAGRCCPFLPAPSGAENPNQSEGYDYKQGIRRHGNRPASGDDVRSTQRQGQWRRPSFWSMFVTALALAFAATGTDAADPSKTLHAVLSIA